MKGIPMIDLNALRKITSESPKYVAEREAEMKAVAESKAKQKAQEILDRKAAEEIILGLEARCVEAAKQGERQCKVMDITFYQHDRYILTGPSQYVEAHFWPEINNSPRSVVLDFELSQMIIKW